MNVKRPDTLTLFNYLREQQLGALRALGKPTLPLPYLMILYASIDVFAYIRGAGSDQEAGTRFRAFCDKYLIPHLPEVTAFDLWGARCSILHTASAESTASSAGKARWLLYSWGSGQVSDLQKIILSLPNSETMVATSFQNLTNAFEKGLDGFYEEMSSDEAIKNNCDSRLSEIYSAIPVAGKASN